MILGFLFPPSITIFANLLISFPLSTPRSADIAYQVHSDPNLHHLCYCQGTKIDYWFRQHFDVGRGTISVFKGNDFLFGHKLKSIWKKVIINIWNVYEYAIIHSLLLFPPPLCDPCSPLLESTECRSMWQRSHKISDLPTKTDLSWIATHQWKLLEILHLQMCPVLLQFPSPPNEC